jgi:hypothetical protein
MCAGDDGVGEFVLRTTSLPVLESLVNGGSVLMVESTRHNEKKQVAQDAKWAMKGRRGGTYQKEGARDIDY